MEKTLLKAALVGIAAYAAGDYLASTSLVTNAGSATAASLYKYAAAALAAGLVMKFV
jgi:hypothetical protein